MFIIGTGKTRASGPPRYRNSGRFSAVAAACATASETPSSAFAPRLFLLGVPSSSISFLSIFAWSSASHPLSAGAILSLTLATAFLTPLPPNRPLFPSRNSHASCSPVLAPLADRCTSKCSTFKAHIDFNGRITVRIQNFARMNSADAGACHTPLPRLEQLSPDEANHVYRPDNY
jgi:hypothetical protein